MQEPAVLRLRAEAHDPLHTGAVIPAAIKQNDLPASRQMADVSLEVPAGALALARGGQRRDPGDPRVEISGHPLDGAALAGSIPSLEHRHHARRLSSNPFLQL